MTKQSSGTTPNGTTRHNILVFRIEWLGGENRVAQKHEKDYSTPTLRAS